MTFAKVDTESEVELAGAFGIMSIPTLMIVREGVVLSALEPGALAGAIGLRCLAAVCAHPDDESFGLGALIASMTSSGRRVSVVSLTHGEASTLGRWRGELGAVRRREMEAAAAVLGVREVLLLDHPDGGLRSVGSALLGDEVAGFASSVGADGLLCFDQGGITGHPDHQRATEAALAAARELGLPVLAWALHRRVAEALNSQFGTSFVGREDEEVDFRLQVDRATQISAVACHASQSSENPVLWRRLELQGPVELARWLGQSKG